MAGCSLIDGSAKSPRVFLVYVCNKHLSAVGSNLGSGVLFKHHILFRGRLRNLKGLLATHPVDCRTLCRHILYNGSIFFAAFTTLFFPKLVLVQWGGLYLCYSVNSFLSEQDSG